MKLPLIILSLLFSLLSNGQKEIEYIPIKVEGLELFCNELNCETDTFNIKDVSSEETLALPIIYNSEILSFQTTNSKLFCNKTFAREFNTYIIYMPEGLDCGAGFSLINCINDTIVSQLDISLQCEHELGASNSVSYFTSDSTFSKVLSYKKRKHSVNDSWFTGIQIEEFLINADGKIIRMDSVVTEKKESD